MNIRVIAGMVIRVSSIALKAASLFLAADDMSGGKISESFTGGKSTRRSPGTQPKRAAKPMSSERLDGFNQPRKQTRVRR